METSEHSMSEDVDADTDRQLVSATISICCETTMQEVVPARLQTLFCVYRL